MANNLDSLSGNFKADGRYNLSAYNTYLQNLVEYVKDLQDNVIKISNELKENVMVQGKWYDDCAANFANWWNDIKGAMDGVDCLNRISTEAEELVEITAVSVCKQMAKSEQTMESYQNYDMIKKFARGNKYEIIQDITKQKLGNIAETKCREGVTLEANQNALQNMVVAIGNQLKLIDHRITDIKTIITNNLINGAAIEFSGLDTSTLNRKVNTVRDRLDRIQDKLYTEIDKDQQITNENTAILKSALSKDYKKAQ